MGLINFKTLTEAPKEIRCKTYRYLVIAILPIITFLCLFIYITILKENNETPNYFGLVIYNLTIFIPLLVYLFITINTRSYLMLIIPLIPISYLHIVMMIEMLNPTDAQSALVLIFVPLWQVFITLIIGLVRYIIIFIMRLLNRNKKEIDNTGKN